jgi:hypothetical protein
MNKADRTYFQADPLFGHTQRRACRRIFLHLCENPSPCDRDMRSGENQRPRLPSPSRHLKKRAFSCTRCHFQLATAELVLRKPCVTKHDDALTVVKSLDGSILWKERPCLVISAALRLRLVACVGVVLLFLCRFGFFVRLCPNLQNPKHGVFIHRLI